MEIGRGSRCDVQPASAEATAIHGRLCEPDARSRWRVSLAAGAGLADPPGRLTRLPPAPPAEVERRTQSTMAGPRTVRPIRRGATRRSQALGATCSGPHGHSLGNPRGHRPRLQPPLGSRGTSGSRGLRHPGAGATNPEARAVARPRDRPDPPLRARGRAAGAGRLRRRHALNMLQTCFCPDRIDPL